MEQVLMIIDKYGILFHVGLPTEFDNDKIIEYAKSGCTITTISIDEFRVKKFGLYEFVNVTLTPKP